MIRLDKKRLASALEARAKEDLAQCHIGGASVLVMQGGEVLYQNHFSAEDTPWASLSERTLFRLASMTKPITAVAAMIFVERGLLSLEDAVEKYYPAFAEMQVRNEDGTPEPAREKITVKQLLTHSSGIASGAVEALSAQQITPADRASVEAYVAFLARQPLSFQPGSKQEYSGTGAFSVLTGILQKIAGMPFEQLLKQEIFEPCRMYDTTFLPTSEQWARLIPMHARSAEGEHRVSNTYEGCVFEKFPAQNFLGGAGLISSLADYRNFAQMLLDGGVFEGRRVLSAQTVAELARPRVYKKETESWGLGVRAITAEKNGFPVGIFGWSGAYGTHFWVDPANRVLAIYMKNSRYDGGSGATTARNFEKDVYIGGVLL